MLQLTDIRKEYQTGDLIQKALDGVSLTLRDNEFVAVLGPSGSGKTTLLNIIGGLDRYDSGDLMINGTSTKNYKDRDWDTYRNHSVGFVFQSYNLIPHQSILANVELSLTIGGVSGSERKRRAAEALTKVGLGDQLHKKPNQLSGGQMQRVAIARALVNDPEILLADEPTGALDTETSLQVMDLLKEVANDRLVVMVTHNPELAETYATRIVRLRDGRIVSDSDPYVPEDSTDGQRTASKKRGKAGMSFLTSLNLSLNNLGTKKKRTFLTALASSIGIIGIALILALSNGVNQYIADIQRGTMASYPITITQTTFDLTSMMAARQEMIDSLNEDPDDAPAGVHADYSALQRSGSLLTKNNLTGFKKYLDDPASEIHQYLGENGIVYTYDVYFEAFSYDADGNLVYTNAPSGTSQDSGTRTGGTASNASSLGGGYSYSGTENAVVSPSSAQYFTEMMAGSGDTLISPIITDSYDLLYGAWPAAYDEAVLVLSDRNALSATTLYHLGLMSQERYAEVLKKIGDGEEPASFGIDYLTALEHRYYIVAACDFYAENTDGTFSYVSSTDDSFAGILASSQELKIVGVVHPAKDAANADLSSGIAYTSALTDYIIRHTDESAVVLKQESDPDINVMTGKAFPEESDELTGLASYLTVTLATYEDNLAAYGKVYVETPSSISLYADSFEDKDSLSECITRYNQTVDEENAITYTDYVALMTSSLTTIVNVISYVLIAFVAVSLIVSCIMIGIITHISVLERTKEIGILRALGASKRNISEVFNAETILVGLFSGLIGVGISVLLTFPINAVLKVLLSSADLKVSLPVTAAVFLVLISMLITLIGGLIPAKNAAKKDPVIALRSE